MNKEEEKLKKHILKVEIKTEILEGMIKQHVEWHQNCKIDLSLLYKKENSDSDLTYLSYS